MNSQWMAYQNSEAFAARVATLYGTAEGTLALQQARYGKLVERFEKRFGDREGAELFSSPARVELLGNHTDHAGQRPLVELLLNICELLIGN